MSAIDKGESKANKKANRLAQQARQKASVALSGLNTLCCWGCKRNSQGNVSYWKGYKLHLDVTDMGIPVTAVVTGANVHDFQLAIAMEKLAERKAIRSILRRSNASRSARRWNEPTPT